MSEIWHGYQPIASIPTGGDSVDPQIIPSIEASSRTATVDSWIRIASAGVFGFAIEPALNAGFLPTLLLSTACGTTFLVAGLKEFLARRNAAQGYQEINRGWNDFMKTDKGKKAFEEIKQNAQE